MNVGKNQLKNQRRRKLKRRISNPPGMSLTVASSHPAVVVGHSNEVIETGPSIRVD